MQVNIITIKNKTHDAIDMSNDYILPDYIVDVRKLVSYDVKAKIKNIYDNDSRRIFEGEVVYTVVVICEDNSIKNLIYSEDFSIECNSEHAVNSVHDCMVDSPTVRLVSSRKLNCRCKVSICTKYCAEEDVGTFYSGCDMPEAEFTTEKMCSESDYLLMCDEEVFTQHASRDIELTSSKDEIASIVYCRINTFISERKVSDGKLYLRGDTVTEILYENHNGDYVKHNDRIPFNDIMEIEDNSTAHLCEVNVSDVKAKVRNNSLGEMKVIEMDYSYCIKCRSYIQRCADLLTDVYSTEYDMQCKEDSINVLKLNTAFSASFSFSDSCSFDDLADNEIMDIVDHNVSVINVNIKPEPLNGRLIITGELKFDIIYKGGEYGCVSIVRPYKYEREYDGKPVDVCCERIVRAQPGLCTFEKGRLLLNAEIYFNMMIAEYTEYKYISEAVFSSCSSNNISPVIIYYPDKSDTLWDIAKRYKTTCKDIISVNSLSKDTLEGVKVLLLPKKKQRPVYNTII